MALTKDDRKFIELLQENQLAKFATTIDEKLAPIHAKNEQQDIALQKYGQTLYGENGNNGLNGDNKKHKSFQRTVVFFFALLQAAEIGIAAYIFLTKNFGG